MTVAWSGPPEGRAPILRRAANMKGPASLPGLLAVEWVDSHCDGDAYDF
jgi:hypothetical protein